MGVTQAISCLNRSKTKIGLSVFILGRMPADHWIKDEGAEACAQCGVRFTVVERRHHCRDCGKLFCAK